ncbi:MAG: HEPN domain-containing protein [Thermoplasmatales archaeon]|nr:HEPN domain-containing protein [Thermoplasmatales archaeon]
MDKNIKEGMRWLLQAEMDLKTSRDCLKDENYYASVFFSQQSAEKALKGFLYSKGYRAIITHSIIDLLKEISEIEENFEKFFDFGKELDRHYIASRYPNFYPSGAPFEFYNKEVAEKCISYAESILKEVKKYLKE